MRGVARITLRLLPALAIGLSVSGCFLQALLGHVRGGDGEELIVSLQGSAVTARCVNNEVDGNNFLECTYLIDDGGPGFEFTSSAELISEFGLLGVFIDPLVVQVPAAASGFSGSFSGAVMGNLVITPGLASVPVDSNTNLVAEAGTQLVVLDFPDPPPPPGAYGFLLDFVMPPGSGAVSFKAIFTGKVQVGADVFYPPMLPCVSDFSQVPSITIPVSSLLVPLNIPTVAGCNGAVYQFGAAAPAPTLNGWWLLALVLCLGAGALAQFGRRGRSSAPGLT
jgi:hypothetical protein